MSLEVRQCKAESFVCIVQCILPHHKGNNPTTETRYYTGSTIVKVTEKFNTMRKNVGVGRKKFTMQKKSANNFVQHF